MPLIVANLGVHYFQSNPGSMKTDISPILPVKCIRISTIGLLNYNNQISQI